MNVQTFRSTLSAEIYRLVAKGGARSWFVVAVVVSVAITAGTVALMSIPSMQEVAAFTSADAVSAGPLFAAVVLALAATSHKAREIADGTVLTSKALVPRALLLFTARLTAWVIITLIIGVVTVIVAFVLAFIPSGVVSSSVGEVFWAVVPALFAAALVVLFFAALAALLQRGAVIVFVGLLLVVILPVGLVIAPLFVSEALGTIAMAVAQGLPGALLLTGTQPPSPASEMTWFQWGRSVLGIGAWIGALSVLAYRQFRKPSYGDS